MKKILLLITVLSLFSADTAIAQEEKDGWLKRLFGKDKNEQVEKEAPADSLNYLLDEFLKKDSTEIESHESNVDSALKILPGNGKVEIIQDELLAQLNDSLLQNPPATDGYRVQIFFGKIDQAKEKRAEFIRQYPEEDCIMEHVPPNFSVQVGKFTDKLMAYRLMKQLKDNYPNAILIPASIVPEAGK
jgi:hypothetical protein